ncbi:hypothetical protein MTBBW1_2620002 [Desulfamplus magnetovallimortis]|uniref:Uncharacterized protein n=1 Tax=Desulfamplus magnetovallimortis TaxID=1246637 RepID=A0A1W1HF62_9BACT|nr:hypothetical protein [Desulfamplus magnetovallimortis]SLM31038.1 hypothetical protein MTBBW1_2620002 [Desulfamplus magnetovallimortis]
MCPKNLPKPKHDISIKHHHYDLFRDYNHRELAHFLGMSRAMFSQVINGKASYGKERGQQIDALAELLLKQQQEARKENEHRKKVHELAERLLEQQQEASTIGQN